MAQRKGQTGNPHGRPKGAKNKRTEQWEAFSAYCMEGGLDRLKRELNSLEGKDYVNAMTNLMEFFKPRLSRTTLTGDERQPITLNFTPVASKDK